jgi:hypothetical protein
MKGIPEAAHGHKNGFLKAAAVDNIPGFFLYCKQQSLEIHLYGD